MTFGGKTGMEFVTDTSPRVRGKVTPMAILITDGVKKWYLRMVTTFC